MFMFLIPKFIIIPFAIRHLQKNPTKPSFEMTMLYSYRNILFFAGNVRAYT